MSLEAASGRGVVAVLVLLTFNISQVVSAYFFKKINSEEDEAKFSKKIYRNLMLIPFSQINRSNGLSPQPFSSDCLC